MRPFPLQAFVALPRHAERIAAAFGVSAVSLQP